MPNTPSTPAQVAAAQLQLTVLQARANELTVSFTAHLATEQAVYNQQLAQLNTSIAQLQAIIANG